MVSHVLRLETVKLQMSNGSTIQALGRFKLRTKNVKTGQKFLVDFVIVKEELLSHNAAEKMGLITMNYNHFKVACESRRLFSFLGG